VGAFAKAELDKKKIKELSNVTSRTFENKNFKFNFFTKYPANQLPVKLIAIHKPELSTEFDVIPLEKFLGSGLKMTILGH
jgi:hypothetical protein